MTVRIFGARPRPRVLILGIDEVVARALDELFPTSRVIADVNEVEQREWDLLVTSQDVTWLTHSNLFVLAIGSKWLGSAPVSDSSAGLMEVFSRHLGVVASSAATEFRIPSGVANDIAALVERDLIPAASTMASHPVAVRSDPSTPANQRPVGNLVSPFLVDSVGGILAGRFPREGSKAECWFLPDYADAVAWAKVAWAHWQESAPDRFPASRADWHLRPEWQTPDELAASSGLEALSVRRSRIQTAMARRESETRAQLEAAQASADSRERSLLTSQGDELVGPVVAALSEVGFIAQEMDEVHASNDRREDLRVTLGEEKGWEAIVEVRSYVRGAQLADLMRLQRFAQRYETETGHAPSASWYVVSQLIGRDPAERMPVLSSNPIEVGYFVEEYSGALIDTTSLLQLWLSVQRGERSAEEAQTLLRNLRGVLML